MTVRTRSIIKVLLLSIPFLLSAFSGSVGAQEGDDGLPDFNTREVIVLDVDLAVRIAQDRSYRMELGRYGLSRSRFNLEASRAALKSNASINFTIPDYDQSIKEVLDYTTGKPRVLSTSAARYSTSLTVRQPLPTNGMLSLSSLFRPMACSP